MVSTLRSRTRLISPSLSLLLDSVSDIWTSRISSQSRSRAHISSLRTLLYSLHSHSQGLTPTLFLESSQITKLCLPSYLPFWLSLFRHLCLDSGYLLRQLAARPVLRPFFHCFARCASMMPRPFILSAFFIFPAPLRTYIVQLVWETGSKNRTSMNSSDCKSLRVGTYEAREIQFSSTCVIVS